jgi:predicted component of type VI protein secretion system
VSSASAPAPEPPDEAPSAPVDESVIERAFTSLVSGPFDKVSITMPAALKARIAERAVDTNFSAYVTEVLAREERRLALIDFLDYMDELYGPPTEEEMAEADRRWEEMWRRHESSEASSLTLQP